MLTGGTNGQVLTQSVNAGISTLEWADPVNHVPAGGLQNNIMTKTSDGDYESEWTDIKSILPVNEYGAGAVLEYDSNNDLAWNNSLIGGNIGDVLTNVDDGEGTVTKQWVNPLNDGLKNYIIENVEKPEFTIVTVTDTPEFSVPAGSLLNTTWSPDIP